MSQEARMRRCRTSVVAVFFLISTIFSINTMANTNEAREIPRIKTPPRLDGKLDDPVWTTAACFQEFLTFDPDYGKAASEQTVVYVCSDGENFYFAARCFQKDVSKIKGAVTRRDNILGDEWMGIFIDTFHNFHSAYAFLVNPLGIQADGMINLDGMLDAKHDMVWYSKGTIDDKGYTVEIKIPFKSIRFPIKKKVKMGLWLVRRIVCASEMVSFPAVYPHKGAILTQLQPILVSKMKYKQITELLPALTHTRTQDHEGGLWAAEEKQTDFSLTGKIGITPSLVLDAAYNPDFSQVEADAGQIDFNLRSALYYTEKRPFFLEGMEEFNFGGNTEDFSILAPINQAPPLHAIVHTRTIIDPVFGLKLTGKINRKNSMAAIFALDEPLNNEDQSENHRAVFGIFRYRHILKKDAYIGGFYTGRDFSGGYNRVTGIDGRLRLSRFAVAEYHLLGSFSKDPENQDHRNGHALGLRYYYNSRTLVLDLGIQDISPDFQIDSGYLRRQGITRLAVFGMYQIYPKSKFFQRIEPYYWSYHIMDKESNLFETYNLFTFRIQMPRSSRFYLDMILAKEVYAGKRFDTSGIGFQAYSQFTKQFYFYLGYRNTGCIFYNPDNPYPGRTNTAYLILEYQPTEKFNTRLEMTYADFFRKSDSQKEYDVTILRSRTTFQTNKYLFFRGIAEYNSYYKKLLLDFLASFTYIPGTVVHIGYGSTQHKLQWNREIGTYVPANRFLETNRAFFFKVSYLWRL